MEYKAKDLFSKDIYGNYGYAKEMTRLDKELKDRPNIFVFFRVMNQSISLCDQIESHTEAKKDTQAYHDAGIVLSYAAYSAEQARDYELAWKLRKRCARLHKKSTELSDEFDQFSEYSSRRCAELDKVKARMNRRNAAVYRATENMFSYFKERVRKKRIISL